MDATCVFAQQPPYDVFPEVKPPYYRVRYEASTEPGQLIFPVNYTIWIPPQVEKLRGVIVHQHGCGEGSCKSGLTGAFDLHWQALAAKHQCALLAPAYEQPQTAECQMWCDPRNGSAATFLRCLQDFGKSASHPELSEVPWALWGHSGGGHWVGGMVMLYPERVMAAWLRSGVPLLAEEPNQTRIRHHTLSSAALQVPMMCNLGTKEGYTVKEGQFSAVWPANEKFFKTVRNQKGLVGLAIDPLSSHDCGNQRYLAIRWLDACIALRMPHEGSPTLPMISMNEAWYGDHVSLTVGPAKEWSRDPLESSWLPNAAIAEAWVHYGKDTQIPDATPPNPPQNVRFVDGKLLWDAPGDLESGIAKFQIFRDGQLIATVPENGKNNFGRPIYQGLSYSDTPVQPLVPLQYVDATRDPKQSYRYTVQTVNTVGLASAPSATASP